MGRHCMGSSKTCGAHARRLLVATAFACSISAAHAQSPPGDRGDLKVTMGVLEPDAATPDSIYRRIPAPRLKQPHTQDDAAANDLADPGHADSHGPTDTAPDPGDRAVPGPAVDPGTPAGPGSPADPGPPGIVPDPQERPDDFGHQISDEARNHGEDARHHTRPPPAHDDKPPHGPAAKPPEAKPPGHQPKPDPPADPRHGPPTKPPRGRPKG